MLSKKELIKFQKDLITQPIDTLLKASVKAGLHELIISFENKDNYIVDGVKCYYLLNSNPWIVEEYKANGLLEEYEQENNNPQDLSSLTSEEYEYYLREGSYIKKAYRFSW